MRCPSSPWSSNHPHFFSALFSFHSFFFLPFAFSNWFGAWVVLHTVYSGYYYFMCLFFKGFLVGIWVVYLNHYYLLYYYHREVEEFWHRYGCFFPFFPFYFRLSSWHPFPPVLHSTPIPSISYYSQFFFFYLPSLFFPSEVGERARDGTARYDSRDELNGDGTGYHFFLEKKQKKRICLFHWNKLFSPTVQGFFSSSPLSPSQVIVLVYVLLSPWRTLPIS